MAKNNTLLFLCLSVVLCTYGGRPSQCATSLVFTQKQCNSYYLNWHNGDGKARLIVAREGAAPDWEPSDNTVYKANNTFGAGLPFGNGNYIVYNSNLLNYKQIKGLKPGITYYFRIFEHDDNGVATQYLTTSAPIAWETTYDVHPDFDMTYYDSCQASNRVRFINTSKATAPGTSYSFHFKSGDTSALDTVYYHFLQSGNIPVELHVFTNSIGCPSQVGKTIRIYQKKVVVFDFSALKDTIQCFYNNSFKVSTTPITNPLSGSYGYFWDYGDGMQERYSFMNHSYQAGGIYPVSLVITTNISKGSSVYPTGCRDTLRFTSVVYDDDLKNAGINMPKQEIHANLFICHTGDNTLSGTKWNFGDNDSSLMYNATHVYHDTGRYKITLSATNIYTGCYGERVFPVYVYDTTKITGIARAAITTFNVYPNPSKGVFIVETGSMASHLEIYSLEGKAIYHAAIQGSGLTEADLSSFCKGIYLVRVYLNNMSYLDKIVSIE